ncbi:MAG: hypothetical protein NVSMB55_14920 [Mycobacteriales bacterium]
MRWLVVALVVLTAVAVGFVVRSSGQQAPPSASELAPGAFTAEQLAQAACVHLRLAQQAVVADSAADTVLVELQRARVLAAAAVDRDSRFSALSGAAAALDAALRADDPGAAGLAVRVVRASC